MHYRLEALLSVLDELGYGTMRMYRTIAGAWLVHKHGRPHHFLVVYRPYRSYDRDTTKRWRHMSTFIDRQKVLWNLKMSRRRTSSHAITCA